MNGTATTVILLIGANGQLGRQLTHVLAPLGKVVKCVRPTHDELGDRETERADLRNPEHIRRVVREVQPNLIVNAAAYTAVDAAENEFEAALSVNAIAPGILAEEAARIDSGLIHFSTDYVFNGTGDSPWDEHDVPDPINVYGKTKLLGEEAVRASVASYLILRTSWLYGESERSFIAKILAASAAGQSLRIVGDQVGAPTSTRFLSQVTAGVAARLIGGRASRPTRLRDILHVACAGETSWYGFAKEVFVLAGQTGIRQPTIECVTSSSYPGVALRPLNSRLDTSKLRNNYGIVVPDWKQELRANLFAMHSARPALVRSAHDARC